MTNSSTLIIGAGPAGLAVGARLRKSDVDFEIVEQGHTVAPSWHNHYERLHLHTVKSQSSLPFIPFPEDYPRYVSRKQLVDYLVNYAEQFNIRPRFGTTVQSIHRSEGGWKVDTTSGPLMTERVVVATGINRLPFTPEWPGLSSFEGDIIHSRDYRAPAPFSNKRCLVIGMGNTGAEIALDLIESNIPVSISVRGPVNIVPRDAFGRPTQLTAIRLSVLPTWLQDVLANLTRKLTVGDLSSYGLITPAISPTAQLREYGKSSVLDIGTVEQIKLGNIRVRPHVVRFTSNGVEFSDGSLEEFDAVIVCTGYRSGIEDIFPAASRHCDKFGNPAVVIGRDSIEGAYFIGFDNYRPGGILGIINTDSKKIADHICGM